MFYLYHLNEMRKSANWPAHMIGQANETFLKNFTNTSLPSIRLMGAANEMMLRFTKTYDKPEFNIGKIEKCGSTVDIKETVVLEKPFCDLRYFERFHNSDPVGLDEPKVLIVAPLSGHYATLLRDTVQSMCQNHNVYITDWVNAQAVPEKNGAFSLSTYVDYLLNFIEFLGTRIHIIAVCQPAVPVLMATSILAGKQSDYQPKSMVLMGGPVDARVNPGAVNQFGEEHSVEWFKKNIISIVPIYYKGFGRSVCPGFLMLNGFINLNLERHQEAYFNMFEHLIEGDEDSAEKHRKFYDEYRAVMDLPAEYFLESVQKVFQEFALPKGKMTWHKKHIDLLQIKNTALLTIEGELDDISCVGQTYAAHTLCTNIPKTLKHHYEQKGVGHYGIFNGRKWRQYIQPKIQDFIAFAENEV